MESEKLTDPREIRKLLLEVAHRGRSVSRDDRWGSLPNCSSAMVRNIFTMAEAEGLSGEDKMTVLAYHALLQYEATMDKLVAEMGFIRPNHFIATSKSGKGE